MMVRRRAALAWAVWCLRGVVGDIALSSQWRESHCVGSRNPAAKVVVAVATDSANLLPILAVINSTVENARHPDTISTVVITRHVRRLHALVEARLPAADVTICGGFSDLLEQRPPLARLKTLNASKNVKRKELLSPFNFAAFYLPYILLETKRVLYLDTDAIVTGDVGELADLEMGGAPAAAVEDCTQKVFKYINYDALQRYDARKNANRAWSRFGFTDVIYTRAPASKKRDFPEKKRKILPRRRTQTRRACLTAASSCSTARGGGSSD